MIRTKCSFGSTITHRVIFDFEPTSLYLFFILGDISVDTGEVAIGWVTAVDAPGDNAAKVELLLSVCQAL